jgi:plastin-1
MKSLTLLTGSSEFPVSTARTATEPYLLRQIDVEDKGSLDKATVIHAIEQSGQATYDQAREALKSTSIDSSGKVEIEDWVQLHSLLKQGVADSLEAKKGKVTVKGTAGTNAQHTINEDERRSFTEHINAVSLRMICARTTCLAILFTILFQVLAGDKDVDHVLPIHTDTMQLFDECRGELSETRELILD